jgi:hypothetical protein
MALPSLESASMRVQPTGGGWAGWAAWTGWAAWPAAFARGCVASCICACSKPITCSLDFPGCTPPTHTHTHSGCNPPPHPPPCCCSNTCSRVHRQPPQAATRATWAPAAHPPGATWTRAPASCLPIAPPTAHYWFLPPIPRHHGISSAAPSAQRRPRPRRPHRYAGQPLEDGYAEEEPLQGGPRAGAQRARDVARCQAGELLGRRRALRPRAWRRTRAAVVACVRGLCGMCTQVVVVACGRAESGDGLGEAESGDGLGGTK